MEPDKIVKVVNIFFDSLKSEKNETLETGLTQNATIDILKQATLTSINAQPKKFEKYVSWFLSSAMYLLEEVDEVSEKIE